MALFLFHLIPVLPVVLYCTVRAIGDARQNRYWWAAAGIGSALLAILNTIPPTTAAVKIDLPRN